MEATLKKIEKRLTAIEQGQGELKMLLTLLTDSKKKSLPRLMSQRKVADYLGISRQGVKKLVKEGLLTPISENRHRNQPIKYKTTQVLALVGYE